MDRQGCIHRIRDVLCVGSHCPGYNHASVGVCLIGGLGADGKPEDNFTDPQRQALANIVMAFHTEWPRGRVKGHSELRGYENHKACPCVEMDAVRFVSQAITDHKPTLSEMTRSTSR